MEKNKSNIPGDKTGQNEINLNSKNTAGEPEPPRKPVEPDAPHEPTPENIPDSPPEANPGEAPVETPRTGDVIGPEINLPGSGNPGPDVTFPTRPHGQVGIDVSAVKQHENTAYRWTYGDELRQEDRKRRKTSGVLTYAIIMTIAFALSFTMLLGVVLYENGIWGIGSARVSDGSVLTIPEIAVKVKPSVVGITVVYDGGTGTGVGTGIIMTADGYIATNYHVIEKGKSFTVTTGDGTEYQAEVIGSDELSDLAVIKVNATGLTAAVFGDSSQLTVGEMVVAIGTPAGLDYAETVTDGIISAINRNVKIFDETGVMVKKMTLIQTNATVNPGNSGGPLIDEHGKVIGIVSMKLANDYIGIGFAIPVNGALTILNEIISTGSSGSSGEIAQKRAIIGITAVGVNAGENILTDGTKINAEIAGVYISEVNEKYDAAEKLKPGDIITEVDGKSVSTVYDVMDIVNNKYAGDSVTVKYYRGGTYNTVTIKLGTEQ